MNEPMMPRKNLSLKQRILMSVGFVAAFAVVIMTLITLAIALYDRFDPLGRCEEDFFWLLFFNGLLCCLSVLVLVMLYGRMKGKNDNVGDDHSLTLEDKIRHFYSRHGVLKFFSILMVIVTIDQVIATNGRFYLARNLVGIDADFSAKELDWRKNGRGIQHEETHWFLWPFYSYNTVFYVFADSRSPRANYKLIGPWAATGLLQKLHNISDPKGRLLYQIKKEDSHYKHYRKLCFPYHRETITSGGRTVVNIVYDDPIMTLLKDEIIP